MLAHSPMAGEKRKRDDSTPCPTVDQPIDAAMCQTSPACRPSVFDIKGTADAVSLSAPGTEAQSATPAREGPKDMKEGTQEADGVQRTSSSGSKHISAATHLAMKKLCRHPKAQNFMRPVDPEADMCPDYFDKIKTPMDLGTIMERLKELTHDKTEKEEDSDYDDSSDEDLGSDNESTTDEDEKDCSDAEKPEKWCVVSNPRRQVYFMSYPLPVGVKGFQSCHRARFFACPALYNDLELVWSNCIAYNGPDFWLSKDAAELRKLCETTVYPLIGMEKIAPTSQYTRRHAKTASRVSRVSTTDSLPSKKMKKELDAAAMLAAEVEAMDRLPGVDGEDGALLDAAMRKRVLTYFKVSRTRRCEPLTTGINLLLESHKLDKKTKAAHLSKILNIVKKHATTPAQFEEMLSAKNSVLNLHPMDKMGQLELRVYLEKHAFIRNWISRGTKTLRD